MKTHRVSWKSIALTFVVALVFYFAAYAWLSQRQTGKGPWQVAFTTNNAGIPQLTIAQPALGISNVIVQFIAEQLAPGQTTGTVAFSKPKRVAPFGRVAYDDLMFQPGVVALDCFGHVVEMAPVALGLNGAAVGWTNAVHKLTPTNKLSDEARGNLKGGYRR